MINIVTVNYPLKGEFIVNTEIEDDNTLLDADLVLIDPSEFSSLWKNFLSPKAHPPTVYSPNSDIIRQTFASRRSEILALLNNGKIIVTFICPVNSFKAEVKRQNYNDTVTNYDILPILQSTILDKLVSGKSAIANSINLSNKKSLFAPYFKAFKDELEYSAYLDTDGKNSEDYFLLNRSNKPVGWCSPWGNGILALLPPPVYSNENQKLLGVLIDCAKKFFTKHEVTTPPTWVEDFKLRGEDEFERKISELKKQLEVLSERKQLEEKQKAQLTKFKSLLYEQGPELENIVIESFKLFGFKAENRKLDDLEHDVVFESKEGKGIAEIEGKDNDAIHIQKLDQLNRSVDEDFELTGKYPQGVLIGNHYRLSRLENRKEPFTEKVLIVAKKKNFGLLTTIELFHAVQKILENPNDENYKKYCRTNILSTTGAIIKLQSQT